MKKNKSTMIALGVCLAVLAVGSIAGGLIMLSNGADYEALPVDTFGASTDEMLQAAPLPPPRVTHNLEANLPNTNAEFNEAGIRDFFNRDNNNEEPPTDQVQPTEIEPQEATPTDNLDTEEGQGDYEEVYVGYETASAEHVVEVSTVFDSFTEGSTMLWPVAGEIAMAYSSDRLIYDETLSQFRTNDTMKIATTHGEAVRAAADATVHSISHSRRDGNIVVLDHGNGWMTTYSQLQDSILVTEGDVVFAGEIIGHVGDASIFTSALGDNLGFRVTQNEVSVDPMLVLN